MNRTCISIGMLLVIFYIACTHGLECYQHDYCLNTCEELSNTIVQCTQENSRCWKFTTPLGTKRGCGDYRCRIQASIGLINTANVCCSSNLCNSSIRIKLTTIAIVFTSLITFMYAREALECYSHSVCSQNCLQLTNTITSCTGDDNRCYKVAFPGGVIRGCAKEQCAIQVDAHSILASVCCENDLCNLAITSKLTFSTLFMIMESTPKQLPPIYGYLSHPLLPLQKALEPIAIQINQLDRYSKIAENECRFPSDHDLTRDGSAAIYLYTIEWGDEFTWRTISSCAISVNIIKDFVGPNSTLFLIEAVNGKTISRYTNFPSKNEVILCPGTRFRVVSDPLDEATMHVVHLVEITDETGDQIASSFDRTSAIPASNNASVQTATTLESSEVKTLTDQWGNRYE
ncbi:unnamed protein product [Rotaria socialis]